MPSTASTLIETAQAILRVDPSTTRVPGVQTAALLRVLNLANLEYLRSFTRGGGEPPSTVQAEAGGTLIASTALAANITTSSDPITVDDSSDAPTSGAFVIYDDGPDIGLYTGNDLAGSLSGISGLGYGHDADDEVSFLYALPSNFQGFRTTADAPYGVLVGDIPYIFTTGEPNPGAFSVYDNGTTKYLWFSRGASGNYTVYYNKTGTTIDETTDSVAWETSYDLFGIMRLVEHGYRALGADPSRAQEARQVADRVLMEVHLEKNVGKKVRARPVSIHRPDFRGVSAAFYPEA